jgi:hypothetical protein
MDITGIETVLRTSSQTTRTEKTKAAETCAFVQYVTPARCPVQQHNRNYSFIFAVISFFDSRWGRQAVLESWKRGRKGVDRVALPFPGGP